MSRLLTALLMPLLMSAALSAQQVSAYGDLNDATFVVVWTDTFGNYTHISLVVRDAGGDILINEPSLPPSGQANGSVTVQGATVNVEVTFLGGNPPLIDLLVTASVEWSGGGGEEEECEEEECEEEH